MVVTWGNTYADSQAGEPDSTTELTMAFQLNFGNLIDLSTADSAGCSTTGSGDSYLQFYLTFLNYDSTTINDLPYDAFVGMIQFHPVAGTPDTL